MLKANLTLKQMYDLFDSDNDGCITKGEMKIGFERFMRTKSDETVDFIFKLCDTSGEGKVTFNEW
jgi:Ca2+-binding EF-hand superfamily protein